MDGYASFAAKRAIYKATEGILYGRSAVRKFRDCTFVGVTAGLILGWMLSLFQGNTFVICLSERWEQ
jgi:hypothetical protein